MTSVDFDEKFMVLLTGSVDKSAKVWKVEGKGKLNVMEFDN